MTLIGYWPLHDTNATDYSGNGNHGTLNGGVTTGVAGKGGLEAMSFDGTDDYITLGDLPEIEGAAEWSVSLWLKYDSGMEDGSNYGIFWLTDGDYTSRAGIRFGQDGNKLGFTGSNDGNSNDPVVGVKYSNLSSGVWYHLVGVYSGSNYYFYVNGIEKANASANNTTSPAFANPPKLGMTDDWGAKLDGKLTDVRVYSRALTSAEIQTLYKMGSQDTANPPTDGVAYYKLDGDATDSWGTNDGTNNGATFTTDAIRKQSANFDGDTDHINAGDLGDPQAVYTVSYWVKPSSTTDPIYSLEYAVNVDTGNYPTYMYRFEHNNVSSGSIEFGVRDGSDNTTELTLTENAYKEWVHVCGIRDGTNVYGYLNGKQVASGTIPNATNKYDGSGEFLLGRRGNGEHFKGKADDVRVYDYALTPSQVHEIYQKGTRGKDMRKHLVNRRQ
jgi:hypothetical protein